MRLPVRRGCCLEGRVVAEFLAAHWVVADLAVEGLGAAGSAEVDLAEVGEGTFVVLIQGSRMGLYFGLEVTLR